MAYTPVGLSEHQQSLPHTVGESLPLGTILKLKRHFQFFLEFSYFTYQAISLLYP